MLLDVHMPGGGGVEVIRQRRAAPARACASSRCRSPTPPEDVIAIIRAGARGYVTKTISAPSWPTRCAASPTATRCSPRGWPASCSTRSPAPTRRPRSSTRSSTSSPPREREVLRHIARGYLYKEIAQRLGISVKTVEAHVSAVLRKLQLSNRHELSRWAVERRLVD